ncbi:MULTISPECIES: hypothetical protein [unclassified Treponema]|uniref:hypothetical protein n=1 Tax=unclassified Treponema TaxID=2638727 RepID=UPI0020A44654|nr:MULTISPECIES: hypothetical protein [unclassified Treponema]UTC67707.1 hypothetical protein E4O06_03265 [Treponema sp. OMZ 789]UTC70435.1 hypothetical protein E4O01_03255 [Treponema sp. OMZ 790]UTC73148.1 hypothetical protein E4O02_03255 [Treponema sp. OMZ 791]
MLLASALLVAACANKEAEPEKADSAEKTETESKPTGIAWYYFASDTASETPCIKKTDSPQSIPETAFKPWTEALRISGLGLMYDPPLFLVNKAGILHTFKIEEEPKLEIKAEFYPKTAEGFYKTGLGSLLRLYTNTVFSPVLPSESPSAMLRYNSVNGELLSLINPENFNLENIAQLSALEFDEKWFAAFKTEQNEQVNFDYFSFSSFEELLKGNYSRINQEEFIKASTPAKTISGDEKIGKILKEAEKNVKLELFSKEAKTKKVIFYQNSNTEYTGDFEITASACDFGTQKPVTKALLFGTGKLFYLDSQTNQWKETALPQLPQGFIYTYFVIQNGTIISGWEEQRFFETGRSGLLIYKMPE